MTRKWAWNIPAQTDPEFPELQDLLDQRADKALLVAFKQGLGDPPGETPCSRSQLQRLIEAGAVSADGRTIEPTERLKPGTLIEVEFPDPVELTARPQDLPIDILYQDEHLLVINKPQGLTVHPSATQADGTLVNALLHHVKDLSGIGGALRPGIVHRIDKNTSGALVITKSDLAHRKLVEVFAAHKIERMYWALCYGCPKQAKGSIDTLIGRNPADRKKMSTQVKSGRRAISHYKVIETFPPARGARSPHFASWLEVTLETGRTHQVRVHLTSLGHSILGDPTYGTPTERQPKWLALPEDVRELVSTLPGQALHARTLGFEHPVTGKTLHFEAEPPEEFKKLLATLKAAT